MNHTATQKATHATRHPKGKKDTTASERKRRQREKLKAMGIKVVEVKLSAKERETLEHCCKVRGGVRGPYDADEYIATLIRRDAEKLKRDLSQLGKCGYCKTELPEGCGGLFKGQCDCWHTLGYRDLEL